MTTDNITRNIASHAGLYNREREFWLNKLSGSIEKTGFPRDLIGLSPGGPSPGEIPFLSVDLPFPPQLAAKVLGVAKQSDARLFMVLVSVLTILLHKYTRHGDIIIGAPIERQDMEGEYINTLLALRHLLPEAPSFRKCLMLAREVLKEASGHMNYPLDAIHNELGLEAPEGESPIFDTAILLDNIHDRAYLGRIPFSLIFSFSREGENLRCLLEYNPTLYQRQSIERIGNHFLILLQTALANADAPLEDLELLTGEKRKELLEDFNATRAEFPGPENIGALFRQQADRTPEAVAIEESDSGRTVTYRDLQAAAGRVAALLAEKNIGAGDIAAIMGQRKIETLAGILGIIQSGACYLPLDAQNPPNRLKFILEDSSAPLLLTQEHLAEKHAAIFNMLPKENIILLDKLSLETGGTPSPPAEPAAAPDDPVYIIYTSGTTGHPKGVVITHRGLVNYISWAAQTYVKDEAADFPLYSSMSFDLTVTSIFTPLVTGNRIITYGGEGKELLVERIVDENKAAVIKLTPSHLRIIRDKKIPPAETNRLRRFIVGGEELNAQLARDIHNNFGGGVEIYNEYGPTETVVGSMIYRFDPEAETGPGLPIGIPIANTAVYLLDHRLRPVPDGVAGEIYIGGRGVAPGYLNRPEMTRQRFPESPFPPGQHIYRTGDAGRWLPGHIVEFNGRLDQQVKVRGFRIELGEIENRLKHHPDIEDAVVVAMENRDDTTLCAYVVPVRPAEGPEPLNTTGIKEFLGKDLPDYMIPVFFVYLDIIPLTPNGKVDKKSLPAPELWAPVEYIAPRNRIEEVVTAAWAETLSLAGDGISIDANFFEIGGHSLNATILITKIHKALDVKVPLVEIFRLPTVRQLAAYIGNASESRFSGIPSVEAMEHYPLSHAQLRLWLLSQIEGGAQAYNMPSVLPWNEPLDRDALQMAFNSLLQRHETLRTSFIEIDGIPRQKIAEFLEMPVEIETAPGSETAHTPANQCLEKEKLTPFDLTRAPLLRLKCLELGGGSLIVFNMHHIISDGLSMDILVKEINQLYEGYRRKKPTTLPDLKIQYKDYVAWEQAELEQRRAELETFWHGSLEGEIAYMDLPIDKPRPPVMTFNGGNRTFNLEDQLTRLSYQLTAKHNITLYVLYLAIFNVFLARICQQDEVTVISGSAGRGHTDLENLIGMFIRTFAIKNRPACEKNFTHFLKEVMERHLQVLAHDVYPYETLIHNFGLDTQREAIGNVFFFVTNRVPGEEPQAGEQLYDEPTIANEGGFNTAKSDLTLFIDETEEGIKLIFEYNKDLFTEASIDLLITRFNHIMEKILLHPDEELRTYDIYFGNAEEEFFRYLEVSPEDYQFICPLTPIQRDILSTCHMKPQGKGQRLIFFSNLDMPVSVPRWKQALDEMHRRIPILNSVLLQKGSRDYLAFRKTPVVHFQYLDLPDSSPGEQQLRSQLEDIAVTIQQPDLEWVNHYLLKLGENRFVFSTSIHRLISDRFSGKVLLDTLLRLYRDECRAPEIPYHENIHYLQHHQSVSLKTDTRKVKEYWKQELADLQKLRGNTTSIFPHRFIQETLETTHAEIEEISAYCSRQNLSISTYFKALFIMLVRVTCGVTGNFFIRANVNGRDDPTRDAAGSFDYAAPLVLKDHIFDENQPVDDYFQYVPAQRADLKDNRFLSPSTQEKLVGKEYIKFFFNDNTFNKVTIGGSDYFNHLSSYAAEDEVHLDITGTPGGVRLHLYYDRYHFTSHRFLERLRNISRQVVAGAEYMRNIHYILPDELKDFLREITGTRYDCPREKVIHEIFRDQAEKTPHRVAVQFGAKQWTYRILDRASNRVARYLRQTSGALPGDLAALVTEHSDDLVPALLGVLKAGCAYVSLDPLYPPDRIRYILAQSAVKIAVVDNRSRVQACGLENYRLVSIQDHRTDISQCDSGSLDINITPRHPALVSFTTGAAGTPKGVMVEHGNVVRLFKCEGFQFHFDERDVWPLTHTYGFNFSVWEIFGALFFSARLLVLPRRHINDNKRFPDTLKKHAVTILNQTPSAFYIFSQQETQSGGKELYALRYIIFSGEALHPGRLKEWRLRYPQTRLINMYGITETTVHVTFKEIGGAEIEQGICNIGKPVPTLHTYVVAPNHTVLPAGFTGELCVGGAGVTRGYINNPGLTEKKFLENPLIPGERLYRSGDLARLMDNGDLEYLGRPDERAQIRGHEEVEFQLLKHEMVNGAVVITLDASAIRAPQSKEPEFVLCAYIVSDHRLQHFIAGLKEYLALQLPENMMPAFFVQVETIPVTTNGRVDKKALPIPEISTDSAEYTPPGSSLEKKLVQLWAGVLNIKEEKIGIDTSFFVLGGHSISASLLTARVNKETGTKLPLAEVFNNPTVRGMAQYLGGAQEETYVQIKRAPIKEYYPLSSAQERVYLIQQMEPLSTALNLKEIVILEEKIDRRKLEKIFHHLVRRHESLRTSFVRIDGKPFQQIHAGVSFELETYRSPGREQEEQLIKSFVRPFRLDRAPLIRAGIIEREDGKQVLLVDIHHIVADGLSMSILVREFMELLRGEILPSLPLQYKDFSHWQSAWFDSPDMKNQETYWLRQFEEKVPPLNIPLDTPASGSADYFDGRYHSFEIGKEQTQALRLLAVDSGCTLSIMLLAAYFILLARYTGRRDMVVGVPIIGRRQLELMEIIGMFANILAMRAQPEDSKPFREFLEEVRLLSTSAYDNQDFQFDQLTARLGRQAGADAHTLLETVFTLQNLGPEDDAGIESAGLSAYEVDTGLSAHYAMYLMGAERPETLQMNIVYARPLFKAPTIEKMAGHYLDILRQVTANPRILLEEISLTFDIKAPEAPDVLDDDGDFGF